MLCWDRGLFFFQAEDGIRDLVRSRGLGDVYKRQALNRHFQFSFGVRAKPDFPGSRRRQTAQIPGSQRGLTSAATRNRRVCLLYTSDAADERSSVDLGGRRIIKKKKTRETSSGCESHTTEYQDD